MPPFAVGCGSDTALSDPFIARAGKSGCGGMAVKSMKETMGLGASPQPAQEALGPNSEIGRKLKQLYDEVLSEDVPDRFARLLADLEQAEGTGKKD